VSDGGEQSGFEGQMAVRAGEHQGFLELVMPFLRAHRFLPKQTRQHPSIEELALQGDVPRLLRQGDALVRQGDL
jgi:hypothetical protein